MPEINDFLRTIEDEFPELQPNTLKPEHHLRDTLEWSSMNALTIMALIAVEYKIKITADNLIKCNTYKELFEMVMNSK
jgi:acyl carrier protein